MVEQARIVWRDRVRTEYQSTQIATRCLGESLAAGEPLEVQRQLLEFVEEELRHVEISGAMCRALGVDPPAPSEVAAPLAALDPVPVSERLLASVISLFLVSETFSLGYLRDLRARLSHPVVTAAFDAIFADEEEHESFAPQFVARLLARETEARRSEWRTFTARIVAGHIDRARAHLAAVPAERRLLELWPEPELAAFGLHGPERLALVALRTHEEVLAPRLAALGLDAPDDPGGSRRHSASRSCSHRAASWHGSSPSEATDSRATAWPSAPALPPPRLDAVAPLELAPSSARRRRDPSTTKCRHFGLSRARSRPPGPLAHPEMASAGQPQRDAGTHPW